MALQPWCPLPWPLTTALAPLPWPLLPQGRVPAWGEGTPLSGAHKTISESELRAWVSPESPGTAILNCSDTVPAGVPCPALWPWR